jgi:hypothetical protein
LRVQDPLISLSFLVKSTHNHDKSDCSSKVLIMQGSQVDEELAKCRFMHLMDIPNPVFEKIAGFFHS